MNTIVDPRMQATSVKRFRVASLRCSILRSPIHSANAGKEARMPGYTVTRLEEADDVLGDYPGEMRMLAGPLGSEQVAFTYRRMPQHTGGKGSYGHRHAEQEEIYFVISGTL